MPQKQKWILISNILLFGGIILSSFSIIILFIYTFIFDNRKGDYIHLICATFIIIGIILAIKSEGYNIMRDISYHKGSFMRKLRLGEKSGFNEGVPNNKYQEFSCNVNGIIRDNESLCFNEIEKGVFECELNNRIIKFDMRYWVRKKFYIYEYFMTHLQISLFRKNKMSIKKLSKSLDLNFNKTKFQLIFCMQNKKTKKYNMLINSKTTPNISFKRRMKQKLHYINKEKINVKEFYNFNI